MNNAVNKEKNLLFSQELIDSTSPTQSNEINKTDTKVLILNESDDVKPVANRTDQNLVNNDFELPQDLLMAYNANDFETLVKKMKEAGNQLELAALLDKLLTPHILRNKEGNRTTYNTILQAIAKNYPEFQKYFLKIKSIDDQGAGFSIFSDKALNFIFEYLKKKGSFSGVDFAIRKGFCYQEDAFEFQNNNLPSKFIAQSINHMLTNPHAPQKCTLIVTAVGGTKHVIPIFIERTKEGIFRCLVSDSVSRSDFTEQALREIRNAFNLTQIPCNGYEVFSYTGFPRQISAGDCSLFSIRDLVIMANNSDYVFKWIKEHGLIKSKDFDDSYFDRVHKNKMPYYTVQFLPPKMMSMTQSKEILRHDYLEEKNLSEVISQPIPSKKAKKKTLQENLSKHIFKRVISQDTSKIKELNLKAEHFYLKYEKIILLKLITG